MVNCSTEGQAILQLLICHWQSLRCSCGAKVLLLELKDFKNSIWLPKHVSFHVFMPFQAPCGVPAGLLLSAPEGCQSQIHPTSMSASPWQMHYVSLSFLHDRHLNVGKCRHRCPKSKIFPWEIFPCSEHLGSSYVRNKPWNVKRWM